MASVLHVQKSPLTPRRFLAVLLLVCRFPVAIAANGGLAQPVGDPAIEARVTRLADELRCLTCMGQSIADSQSLFSSDMKREMRAMITAGKSETEIIDFMV